MRPPPGEPRSPTSPFQGEVKKAETIMPTYKAPVEDVKFLLNDVFHMERYGNMPGFADASPDVVAVLEATRDDPRLELGASPRAGLMLLKASKALAALEGRDHALPDDVQALAEAVLPHRLLLAPEAAGSTRAHVVRAAIERVPAL